MSLKVAPYSLTAHVRLGAQAIDGARPDVLITFPALPAIETQVLPGEINQLGYFNKFKNKLAALCFSFPGPHNSKSGCDTFLG